MDTEAMKNVLIQAFDAAPRGTQSRIADELGVRVTAVNKWAKGHNLPEPHHWSKLEGLLGLPVGTFTPPANENSLAELMLLVQGLRREVFDLRERLDGVESLLEVQPPARSGSSDPEGRPARAPARAPRSVPSPT